MDNKMLKTNKKSPKICKSCKKPFLPSTSMQKVCSVNCSIKYVAEQGRIKQERRIKKEIRQWKHDNETKPQLIKKAQKSFNAYIKVRDMYKPCISCDKPMGASTGLKMDPGHWFSVGSHTNLRFFTWNCHGQCVKCNDYQSGNSKNYDIGMAKRFGLEYMREKEAEGYQAPLKNYSHEDLRRIAVIFRKKRKLYLNLFRQ